jgi:hypothetical protein
MEKFHYYSFSFIDGDNNTSIYASVYVGYIRHFVSMPQLEQAKTDAKVSNTATLLSCCYLGKMTKDEMETGITTSCTLTGKVVRLLKILKLIVGFPGK